MASLYFSIVERRRATMNSYGNEVLQELIWDIKRNSDGVIIKSFNDYLEALKYHEALEERVWLES